MYRIAFTCLADSVVGKTFETRKLLHILRWQWSWRFFGFSAPPYMESQLRGLANSASLLAGMLFLVMAVVTLSRAQRHASAISALHSTPRPALEIGIHPKEVVL